jgi:LuxR family maltose regulon positive regulatory protein
LDETEKSARARGFIHRLPEIAALQCSIFLRRGDIAAADQTARRYDIPLVRARVLLARNKPAPAQAVLRTLAAKLESQDRRDEQLRVLMLDAVACYAQNRPDEAVRVLFAVLDTAEREGFVRIFLDEGAPMASVFADAAARELSSGYIDRILVEFEADRQVRNLVAGDVASPLSQSLIDPLSPREIQVLRLVAEGLSNQAIGERLFLALDTIKGNNRRIFEKLGVKRRTEAVARARELGIL